MGVSSAILAGLLAVGPQSAILDLPYPEVATDVAAASKPETLVTEALAHYARGVAQRDRAMMAETLHPEFTRVTIRRNGIRPDAIEVATARTIADSPITIAAAKGAHEVSELKVDGGRASAKLTFSDRTELVHLVLWNHEWRVVQSLSEAHN